MASKYYTTKEIIEHKAFIENVGGHIDTFEDYEDLNKFVISVALSLKFLPKKIVDEVLKNCAVVYAPTGIADAAYISKDAIKDRSLIIWYRPVANCNAEKNYHEFIVAFLHEIGHYKSGHKQEFVIPETIEKKERPRNGGKFYGLRLA